jgi:RNA binding exosome subunit
MPNIDLVLKYNAIRVLQNMKIDDNDPTALNSHSESLRVLETIECASLEAFVELLQRGFKMSYFTMNRLILKMLFYFQKGSGDKNKFDRIYSEVYVSMLKSAIALGVPIDKYQLDHIARADPKTSDGVSVAQQVKNTYAIPLWKKACATSQKAKLPKSVELYAASLGIGNDPSKLEFNMTTNEFDFLQPTKREICTGLAAMMIKPSDEVKREALERLRKKMEVTTPKVSDLVLGKYTVPVCENTGYFGNPLEYNDATLAYYRDAKESLYCFPSTMYKELIETRRNPYTNEELPTDLLIKMDKTLEIFKRLNIDTDKTVPVSVAFKKLNSVEDINNERTDYAVETVSMLFYSRGLRKEWIQNQNANTYNLILDIPDISMNQSYLKNLDSSPNFRYATFCKALYFSGSQIVKLCRRKRTKD